MRSRCCLRMDSAATNMWRYVAPHFQDRYRVVLFDYAGHGGSKVPHNGVERYGSLDSYAEDVLAICRDMDLNEVVFVGHSVSSMIGVLAAIEEPERFAKLVLVGPSPRHIDVGSYVGGFNRTDIEELLESLESNYLGWSSAMAPVIMGNADRPQLGEELKDSFCRTDPEIARQFARATFLSDNRDDLAKVNIPALVLQARNDAIGPVSVGQFVSSTMPQGSMVMLEATGHCPHLSMPEATTAAIAVFVGG